MFRILFGSMIFFSCFCLSAQNSLEDLLIKQLEFLADDEELVDINGELEEIHRSYADALINPLQLNIGKSEDFRALGILNPFQVFSLQQYLRKYGPIKSIAELYYVTGFDSLTVQLISPIVAFDQEKEPPLPSLDRIFNRAKQRILIRSRRILEQQHGYTAIDNGYEGSPYYLYLQYKFRYSNQVLVSFTAEKDPGEAFFNQSQATGFDYYGFSVQLSRFRKLKQLVIGDFRASFGQGISLWTSFSFSKTADIFGIMKQGKGVVSSSSADESSSFRGVAACLEHKSWTFSPFVSFRYKDATIRHDSLTRSFTSIQNSGYHRTAKEIQNKNSLSQTVTGFDLGYNRPYFTAGVTTLYYRYGADNNLAVKPYNMYRLQDSKNSNISVYAQYLWRNVNVFSSFGLSYNGGKALLIGSTVAMNRWVQLALLYRNYEPNYQADFAKSFGQNSRTENEIGHYVGIKTNLRNWTLSGYVDTYAFPWMRYNVDSPSVGWDYLLNADCQTNRNMSLQFKVQQAIRTQNTTKAVLISYPDNPFVQIKDIRYQSQINFLFNNAFHFQTRVAFRVYDPEIGDKATGVLIYQDMKYTFQKTPLTFSLRYAVFDTDGWNARLYAYEADLLYAFSVPAYYNKGSRYYLNLSYKLTNNLQVWARIAQTNFRQLTSIGSGLSTISGNRQTEAKVQLQYKW